MGRIAIVVEAASREQRHRHGLEESGAGVHEERNAALRRIRGLEGDADVPRQLGMFHPRALNDQSVWVEAPLGDAWTVGYRIVGQKLQYRDE